MFYIIINYFERKLDRDSEKNKKIFNYISLIIVILIFILEFLIVLVFLEYIELNCVGLNQNTKRNILKREKEESAILNDENNNNNDSSLLNENDININNY